MAPEGSNNEGIYLLISNIYILLYKNINNKIQSIGGIKPVIFGTDT